MWEWRYWLFSFGTRLRLKCPVEEILFYSLPFNFIYFKHAASIERSGWVYLPVEQTGKARSPITHIATANQLKLQKTVAR